MDILEEVRHEYEYMVKKRRFFHENPEVSGIEVETLKAIEDELDKIGIEWIYIEDGGILGKIVGNQEGKTVLLRADIDALPIEESEANEKQPKECISKKKGVSHACGHDTHIAMLLAESKILQKHKDILQGTVLVCFEQGEEGTGNIIQIVRYIEKNRIKIDSCYATHVRWDVPVGKICVNEKTALSGLVSFDIKLKGKAGHGSRPDLGNSVIDCFVSIYNVLQSLKMKYLSPEQVITFSVGTVAGGIRRNVIPEDLHFEGTIRFYDNDGGICFWEEFKRTVREISNFYHIESTIGITTKYLPTQNNEQCRDICRKGIIENLGESALYDGDTWMASESMSYFLAQYPGVNTFTGIRNEEKGMTANHHTAEFEPDESGMIIGATAAIAYVLAFMNNQREIQFIPTYNTFEDLITYCKTV